MEPRFRFKDFVIIKEDVPFWGNIKGQIINFENQNIPGSINKYLVKIKKSNITVWLEEADLRLRNEEVTKAILDARYD